MKQPPRYRRILILSLLSASVFAPLFFLSARLATLHSSPEEKVFVNDISGIRQSSDALRLKSIEQTVGEGVKEPERLVLKDRDYGDSSSSRVSDGLQTDTGDQGILLPQNASGSTGTLEQEKSSLAADEEPNKHSGPRPATDEKLREIKDQLIMAKAYLHFAPPNSNSHLVRELKTRIKDLERVIGHANKDSDLSRSALQKKRAMEVSLTKARKVYPDCSAMATKLRSMAYNTEEQLRVQKSQASFLVQLAARTFPKGLHCLSMRLTAEYFALQPAERELPNKQRLKQPDLYHYAIFSDNVLACAVVVNSTISTSVEQAKIVFHVVTDALNHPAMTMWFLLNPPGQATVQIESMDDFNWLPSSYSATVKQLGAKDPRFSSSLNHLRFYLPQIFPYLDKVLLLDHDVVVQRDLSGLWKTKMKGKVNGAVEICKEGESFHRLEVFVDFSDPTVAKSFDRKSCLWGFGMNIFDLRQWQRGGLTNVYHKWLHLLEAKKRPLLKAGSLPLGQITFYNHTLALSKRWHVLGLGYNTDIGRGEIERAAVIHYDGNMKPWLEISIPKYRGYWNKYLNYDLQYLQQCNIHE